MQRVGRLAGRLTSRFSLYPSGRFGSRTPGTALYVPSDLASEFLFGVLFLAGVTGLLFLLAWLEPAHGSKKLPPRSRSL